MVTRIAAVQLPFSYFRTPQEFADYVRAPIELAAEHGAQLILLPHLTSFMLFGMFDSDSRPGDSLDQLAARQNMATRDWLAERASYVFEFHLHLFQSLSARVERWLAPGTVLELEADAMYMSAFLFNPAGEIIGRQRAMHPDPTEITWGVTRGETLRVMETEIGELAFIVGGDANDPGIAQHLVSHGASILLHPSADDTDTFRQSVSGTFGVQANLVGEPFRGRSAIFAPIELTEDKRGILAQANTLTDGEMILANLELDKLPSHLRAGEQQDPVNAASHSG